ncbi:hypothetical protein QYF61_004475 [Mycteria americana]|uniref:RNase H type-1 domain-containing protein n=1 Tax=Mycteria americana TaxID=33587 RepID=A0AAN7N6S2_MYCAM|nr:hypothetical protein QYF61_004475 [Mycteria americana]
MVAGNRALELSENRRVNMYSDSKYAFGVGHARGAVWKERGLLPSQGTPIQHGKAILEVLQAVLEPKEASVIHCKAHEKGQTDILSGNRKADETAQRAALTDSKHQGVYQYAYNGSDFITFDMDTMTFTAADAAAQITERKWVEAGTVAESLKH